MSTKAAIEPSRGRGALTGLDERTARSSVGADFLKRQNFADAYASLWIDGELVHLEDLALHDAFRDPRTPAHEVQLLAIAEAFFATAEIGLKEHDP